MNYKLEKFWNSFGLAFFNIFLLMNYKLEKFWNGEITSHLFAVGTMNYKLEKFWNTTLKTICLVYIKWTINLKSFEILYLSYLFPPKLIMNYKLEKFWNILNIIKNIRYFLMNYKLEKFWNNSLLWISNHLIRWTINLKSFEI